MNSVIQEMVGKKVSVYSINGEGERQDVGVLEAVDGLFLKLKKGETEAMYFAIANVRMIKNFL